MSVIANAALPGMSRAADVMLERFMISLRPNVAANQDRRQQAFVAVSRAVLQKEAGT